MARTKVDAKRPLIMGPVSLKSRPKERDAGSGTEEDLHLKGDSNASLTIEGDSNASFTVILKSSHFCFSGGSENLEMPRGFDLVPAMRGGDIMGPGDWVKLTMVDHSSFKGEALVYYNDIEDRFELGDGCEDLVDEYMLVPGTRLSFSLVKADPLELNVKIDKKDAVNKSSDENEVKAVEVETSTELEGPSRKKHRRSRSKASKCQGSGYKRTGGPGVVIQ